MMPMLACPLDIGKVTKYSNYTMEVKLDGVRCVAVKSGDEVLLYTRSGKDLTAKLPHIVEQLKLCSDDFTLDGELGYINQWATRPVDQETFTAYPLSLDFNATMRVLGSGVDEALRKQFRSACHEKIQFVVFDYVSAGTPITLPQELRRHSLEDFMWNQELRDLWISTSWERFDDGIYNFIVEQGGEGVMLKNPRAEYYPGKRKANTWYKLKKFDTIDAKIVGYDQGEGKYASLIGALVAVDDEGREIRISGMTDAVRLDMTCNFARSYNGKMVEIKYFGKIGSGGYRHPQFLRMRPDKD